MKHFYCGVDVSDKSSAIYVTDDLGEKIYAGDVKNDSDGIRQYFEKSKKMIVGLETCGISAWIAQEIAKYGHEVHVMDSRSLEAMTKGLKTDKIDAKLLAQILRGKFYREVHKKSDESRRVRSMIMARGGMVQIEAKLAVQIQSLMKHWGLRVGSSKSADFFEQIRKKLEQAPELSSFIEPIVETLICVRKQLKSLNKALRKESNLNEKAKLLMTVPGVKDVTAMAYLATIDDEKRFKKSRQVGPYLGLTARISQSGESIRYGRITKQGDSVLRGYLLMAAHSVLSKCRRWTKLKAWGLKIAKKKGYSKAKVAVARRLAVIMHRMLIDNQAFDYAKA